MAIDEACIDRIVERMESEITECFYEWIDNDRMMIATLGEIRGLHQLAEELKLVLRG